MPTRRKSVMKALQPSTTDYLLFSLTTIKLFLFIRKITFDSNHRSQRDVRKSNINFFSLRIDNLFRIVLNIVLGAHRVERFLGRP